ncbi:Fc.00g000670.m01.CDS01 [Cosmosporella sp. VM-42]
MGSKFSLYTPLCVEKDEIRLLTINAATAGSDLTCRLETVSLQSKPHYEALSYVWGSPDNSKAIFINNISFNVQLNLFTALQRLRNQSSLRIMWIDAVCINQRDDKERENQVRKMTDIYSLASGVLVWIGEETPESTMALHFIQSLPPFPGDLHGSMDAYESQLAPARKRFINTLRTDNSAVVATKAFFTEILQREYWNRVWIIQEVVLGTNITVQCGKAQVPWDMFFSVATNLLYCLTEVGINPGAKTGGSASMSAINSIRQLRSLAIQVPIGDLIAGNRNAKATQNIDFVFGFLGIAKHTDDPLLAPDYTRSEGEVFTNVVEHHATVYRNLDLICMSLGVVPVSPTRMASWVPDWPELWKSLQRRTPAERRPILPIVVRFWSGEILSRAYTPYQTFSSLRTIDLFPVVGEWDAALGIPAMAQVARQPDILMARGVFVDELEDIGAVHMGGPPDGNFSDWNELMLTRFGLFEDTIAGVGSVNLRDLPDRINRLLTGQYGQSSDSSLGSLVKNSTRTAGFGISLRQLFLGVSKEKEKRYIDGSSLLQAYITTILAGRLLDVSRFDTEDYTAFWSGQFPGLNKAAEAHRFLMIAQSLKTCSLHRRLAVSKKGYLLACTANVKEGDTICVLYGCSVPVVLREVDDHHVFVGEAYAHGLMDGQAVKQVQESRSFEQDFCIY